MIKKAKKNRQFLYHGTTEAIAKLAPVKGIVPYAIPLFDNGKPRAIGGSANGVSLTDIYAGFSAFDTCSEKERWGLIEIDVEQLSDKLFAPHELFLIEKSKKKISTSQEYFKTVNDYREKLSDNRKQWKESLSSLGLCVYTGVIPAKAINKVTIYDWRANWFVTKEIFNVNINSKSHKIQYDRQKLLTQWLMCEAIDPNSWCSNYETMTATEREPITSGVVNKWHLDLYYQASKK